MTYLRVANDFLREQPRAIAGDIILLNRIIREHADEGDPTSADDCEALLLDCCAEYHDLPANERRDILAHTSALGGGR